MDITRWHETPRHIERVRQKDYGDAIAVYYDSIPYRGRDTKVFAYLAMPPGDGPVPGVVLLHGGGGTAYPQWAQAWAQRGYAALALDMEGNEPVVPGGYERVRHVSAGPGRTGDFDDTALPVQEQWMYHGLAAASRGLSWLRSNPRVKAQPVGLVGISWGSMAAGILVTLDRRFDFCVPIYGCGCLPGDPAYFGPVFAENPEAARLWDPSGRFPAVKIPMLLVNGLMDTSFSLLSTVRSQALLQDAQLCLRPDFPHGHEPAWEIPEPYAFADGLCGRGARMPIVKIARDGEQLLVFLDGLQETEAYQVQLIYSPTGIKYAPDGQCRTEWILKDLQPVQSEAFLLPYPAQSRFLFVNCVGAQGVNTSSNVLADC